MMNENISQNDFTPWKFFGPFLIGGFSLNFEWQQVPSRFHVFKLILIVLFSGWSQFFLRYSVHQISFPGLWRPFQRHTIDIMATFMLCSFFSTLAIYIYLSYFIFTLRSPGTVKSMTSPFLEVNSLGLVMWSGRVIRL